jgi:hypothetical protein
MAHNQEVVGLSPGPVYWMDVRDNASYYIKEKNKGSQMGHTKKIFKKSIKVKNCYVFYDCIKCIEVNWVQYF